MFFTFLCLPSPLSFSLESCHCFFLNPLSSSFSSLLSVLRSVFLSLRFLIGSLPSPVHKRIRISAAFPFHFGGVSISFLFHSDFIPVSFTFCSNFVPIPFAFRSLFVLAPFSFRSLFVLASFPSRRSRFVPFNTRLRSGFVDFLLPRRSFFVPFHFQLQPRSLIIAAPFPLSSISVQFPLVKLNWNERGIGTRGSLLTRT